MDSLEISSHIIKKDKLFNLKNSLKFSYWLLLILGLKEIFPKENKRYDIPSTFFLIASVFIEMLCTEDVISNYIIE